MNGYISIFGVLGSKNFLMISPGFVQQTLVNFNDYRTSSQISLLRVFNKYHLKFNQYLGTANHYTKKPGVVRIFHTFRTYLLKEEETLSSVLPSFTVLDILLNYQG